MAEIYHQGGIITTHPPHFPTMYTRETVTHLAAFGLDERQVAVILKCTVEDVRKWYVEEMEHGLARVNAQVMSAVLHAALHEDSAADRKLWLVNKAGWKGDGAKNTNALLINPLTGQPVEGQTPDGELTVFQRREVITRVLTSVARKKREDERVIEGTVVPKKTNGNGSNGSGTGHGNGAAGNGTKHK